MAGMVGDRWSLADFAPMDVIPNAVSLTTYSGDVSDFMAMPLQHLVDQVSSGQLAIAPGRVFHIDDIVDAHRTMESNQAGGKIVVLTR
jgi:NADPH:quinone reductase-like Zn-dependent oxidoreductase